MHPPKARRPNHGDLLKKMNEDSAMRNVCSSRGRNRGKCDGLLKFYLVHLCPVLPCDVDSLRYRVVRYAVEDIHRRYEL